MYLFPLGPTVYWAVREHSVFMSGKRKLIIRGILELKNWNAFVYCQSVSVLSLTWEVRCCRGWCNGWCWGWWWCWSCSTRRWTSFIWIQTLLTDKSHPFIAWRIIPFAIFSCVNEGTVFSGTTTWFIGVPVCVGTCRQKKKLQKQASLCFCWKMF